MIYLTNNKFPIFSQKHLIVLGINVTLSVPLTHTCLFLSLSLLSPFPTLWWAGCQFIMWHVNEKSSAIARLLAALVDPWPHFIDMRHNHKSHFCMHSAYHIIVINCQTWCHMWYLSTHIDSNNVFVLSVCVCVSSSSVFHWGSCTPANPTLSAYCGIQVWKQLATQSLQRPHSHTH